jgi:hypothetical protein
MDPLDRGAGMSTHQFPWIANGYVITAAQAVTAAVRAPSDIQATATTITLTYDPDLTPAELVTVTAVVDDVVSVTNSWDVQLSLAEWQAIRPHIATIRDLRQMGRNAFMALTAAERDRLLYDAQAATTTILLALLRE